jgi:hypothetical protein
MWGRGKHLSWLTLLRRVFKTSLSYPFYIHAGGSVYLFFVPLTSSTFQRLFQTIRLAGSWCGQSQPSTHRAVSGLPAPSQVRRTGGIFLGFKGFLCGPCFHPAFDSASIGEAQHTTAARTTGVPHSVPSKLHHCKHCTTLNSDRVHSNPCCHESRSLSALASTRCESVRRPVEDTDSARVGLVPPPCLCSLLLARFPYACKLALRFSLLGFLRCRKTFPHPNPELREKVLRWLSPGPRHHPTQHHLSPLPHILSRPPLCPPSLAPLPLHIINSPLILLLLLPLLLLVQSQNPLPAAPHLPYLTPLLPDRLQTIL